MKPYQHLYCRILMVIVVTVLGNGHYSHLQADHLSTPGTVSDRGALEFMTKSDHVEVTNTVDAISGFGPFDLTAALTIETWIYVDSYPGSSDWAPIVSKGKDWGLYMRKNGQTQQFAFNTGTSTADELVYEQLPAEEWHHVAATFDGTTKRLYIDGIERTSVEAAASLPVAIPGSKLIFGEPDTSTKFFAGSLDAIRIWSTARSSAEIQADRDRDLSSASPPSGFRDLSGLLGEWRLDEKTGTEAFDSSGKGFDGKLTGTPNWIDGLAFRAAPPLATMPKHALRFDGSAQQVEIAHESDIDLISSLTLETWINVVSFDRETQPLVTKGDAWGLFLNSDSQSDTGNLVFRTGGDELVGTSDLLPGRWYHVTAVFDGTEKRIYVDAHEDAPLGVVGGLTTNNAPVVLGGNADDSDQRLNAILDTVRVWNEARSQTDIEDNAFNVFQSHEPNLLAEWRLDEVRGDQAYDLSLGDNRRRHGSIVSFNEQNRVPGLALTTVLPIANEPSSAIGFSAGSPDLTLASDPIDEDILAAAPGLTLETWVKLNAIAPGESQAILSKGNAWGLALEADGPDQARVVFYSYDGSVLHQLKSQMTIGVDQWHHVTAVYDGSDKFLYIDGLTALTTSQPVNFSGGIQQNTQAISLGLAVADAPVNYANYDGILDTVRVWTRARTPTEIASVMDHRLRGTETGLFAAWRFVGSDPLADSSIGMRDLDGVVTARVKGLSFGEPVDGELALAFYNIPGSSPDQFVEIPEESEFDFEDGMTVETWVFVDDSGAKTSLVSKGDGAWGLNLASSGKIQFITAGIKTPGQTAAPSLFSTQKLGAGEWYHVAATIGEDPDPNVSGLQKVIYINGVADKSETGFTGTITTNDLPVLLGAEPTAVSPGPVPVNLFGGVLDETRAWSIARTAQQIRDNHARVLNGNEPGLTANWRFNEIQDLSSAPNSGLAGGVLDAKLMNMNVLNLVDGFEQGAPAAPQYGLFFDGLSGYLTANAIVPGTSLTIEAWVKPEQEVTTGAWRTILQNGIDGSGLAIDADNFLRYLTGGTQANESSSSRAVQNGEWQHVAVVVDGEKGTTTFYINGSEEGSHATATIGNGTTGTLFIGRGSNSVGPNYFHGAIDEVRIWTSAIDPRQIALLAFLPLSSTGGQLSNLAAHWAFDAGTGSSASDGSVNGNEATLKDASWGAGPVFPTGPLPAGLDLTKLSTEPASAGLWVGSVFLSRVNEVQRATNGSSEQSSPTADTFPVRILLHVDTNGSVSLLKDVIVMQTRTDPADLNSTTVPVLVTDPSLIPSFEGVVQRSGKLVGLRYGTAFYDFEGLEVKLLGGIGDGLGCAGKIQLAPDHSTNPFRHKFHPQHRSGFDIKRQFSIQFDDSGLTNGSSYNVDRITGVYRESVTGLHKIPIIVEGRIALERISNIGRLN